jgi:hypothetical protein
MPKNLHQILSVVLALALLIFVSLSDINITRAALVDTFSVSLSTIEESVDANHTLTFTINDSWDASDTLYIDYPDGFDLGDLANTEPEDFDITDDAAEKTIVANGSCSANSIEITTVDSVTDDRLTFTLCSGSTAIASGSVIVVEIGTHATAGSAGNDQIANQTAAQNATDATVSIGGTFGGTGSAAVEIVSDSTTTVNATVGPSITCSFAGTTTTFSNLTTGLISSSDTNTVITVSTNAESGFNLTVRDAGNGTNPGLYKSSTPTSLIGSADDSFNNTATLSAGTDGFGIQASTSGGSGASVTIATRYDQAGNDIGGLELTDTSLASATGAVSSRAVTIVHKAAVGGLTPAGSYTDTLTYVCTGIF